MNSSGIRRGLAATAISALAVAGLPFLASSASAESVNDQIGAGQVVLFNQSGTSVSLRPDGTDSTVRLEAGAGSDIGSVTFQYSLDGTTFVDVSTVARNDDGAFSFEWDAIGLAGATNVTLRAISASGPVDSDVATGVTIAGAGAGVSSVNILSGSTKGVFAQPYSGAANDNQNVIIDGTVSEAGAVVIARDDNDVFFPTGGSPASVTVPTGSTTGTFRGVLDISGYDFSGIDELVVGAQNQSQDFESFTLYNQVITNVTAVADRTNVPVGGAPSTITITVTDQRTPAAPIAGAEVRSSAAGNPLIGYTDANGQVTTTQTAAAGKTYYFANATDSDPFEPQVGDKRSADITIDQFVPVGTSLVATSRDGATFDFDENVLADITVQVKDQNNGNLNPDDSQDLRYFFVLTPFDGSAPVRFPTTGTSEQATESAPGEFQVPLPTGAGVESGTFELFAELEDNVGTPANDGIASSKVLTFKAGQAKITFDETGPQTAAAGDQEVVAGKLVLEDGTGLGGRSVKLDYTPGGAANGSDTSPDAGFADGPDTGTAPDTTKTVVTNADGSFSVVVDDPAETPQGTEIGGVVTADTVPGTVDMDDPMTAAATQTVNFSSATPPAGSTVTISDIGTTKPGVAIPGTATVLLPDGPDADALPDGPVAGQQVTLTIPAASGAFFTDGTYDPAPVVGAKAGSLKSLGRTLTLTTNNAGQVSFQVGIKRDAGFDDDGLVEVILTATSGPASDTEDVDFNSANPLNGGDVQLVLSPASEQSGNTNPAATNQVVAYDVFTTDQFGNLVGGELVDISEDGLNAFLNPFSGNVTSDFDDNGDFTVTSTDADVVTITATWNAPTAVFAPDDTNDTDPIVPGVQGDAGTGLDVVRGITPLRDTADQRFAAFNLSAATITFSGNPEDTAVVGSAVTETVTVVDEFGNPVRGLQVTFDRSGPGAGNVDTGSDTTNANGVATYTFVGTAKGVATINAEVTDGTKVRTVTDSVTFTAGPPPPPVKATVIATLTAPNNGAASDRISIATRAIADGAKVRLFTRKGDKTPRILVATKFLNSRGKTVFNRPDRNGNNPTRYWVVVSATSDTKSDRSNTRFVR